MSDVWQDVVDYVAQFDPSFPDQVEGASAEEIEELERLLPEGSLPEVYRGFLQAMGRSTDWINIRNIDFHIEVVLDYYRLEHWLPANRYVRIGLAGEAPGFHPHLEILPVGDSPVIAFPETQPKYLEDTLTKFTTYLAGSLPELFAMPVFEMYEIYSVPREAVTLRAQSWRRRAVDDLEEWVASQAMERLFFSSRTGRAWHRPDAAIRGIQRVGMPLEVRLAADDPRQTQHLATLLHQDLSLERVLP